MDLDNALEEITVHPPGGWENSVSSEMLTWYAVSTPKQGIVAYFADEGEALYYRLSMINRLLNPLPKEYNIE